MLADRLVRLPRARDLTGLGTTSIYAQIGRGLFPPAVRLTARCVAWPESEIAALNAARIAGKSDVEIKQLVRELVAARKQRAAAA